MNKNSLLGKRLDLKYVKKFFEERDCEFLDTEYINSRFPHNYKCQCGNISKIRFRCFRDGTRCKKCGRKKGADSHRNKLEYVKKYFKDRGCEYLDTNFLDSKHLHNYKCICGRKDKICFSNFKENKRCKKCGIIKVSGKNAHQWNPNLTDEDRQDVRKYPEYKQWRTSVFTRDNFTCHICNTKGGYINAHHLHNYSSNKELRTDVNNGKTLCKKCHKTYHGFFTNRNNTQEQYDKFLPLAQFFLGDGILTFKQKDDGTYIAVA